VCCVQYFVARVRCVSCTDLCCMCCLSGGQWLLCTGCVYLFGYVFCVALFVICCR